MQEHLSIQYKTHNKKCSSQYGLVPWRAPVWFFCCGSSISMIQNGSLACISPSPFTTFTNKRRPDDTPCNDEDELLFNLSKSYCLKEAEIKIIIDISFRNLRNSKQSIALVPCDSFGTYTQFPTIFICSWAGCVNRKVNRVYTKTDCSCKNITK